MPEFAVKRYETYVATYHVYARTAAKAVFEVINGSGCRSGLDYVGPDRNIGMRVDGGGDALELAESLEKLGVEDIDDYIQSICDVKRVR